MKENYIQYKLLPSGMHLRNLADKGIQTSKKCFKSVLCGVDDLFPLNLWDRINPQTYMQVNLLRKAKETKKSPAYA